MSPSYGYAYLTSYGWTGSGTGLRNGAIANPLAIPPKKNLSGLGRDRDEAFPFWDHLFTAASKAITIRVSSDDEDADDTEDPSSHADFGPVPIRRTTTGIPSNRRPIVGTPASTSGGTTPSLSADTDIPDTDTTARLSLLATAKREAAKRGLYARFFRGPVLGPDDDQRVDAMAPSSSVSSSTSTPVPEHVGDQEGALVGETKKNEKRKLEDGAETKHERRERKRLKKERKAARAAKKAEENLTAELAEGKRNRKTRRDEEVQAEESQTLKKARKRVRKSLTGPAGDDLEQKNTSHRPPNNVDAFNVVLTAKKKKGKRRHTPP